MKKEKPLSKEEIINEFLSEMIEGAGEELGLHGTKRLPERSDGSSGSAAA